MKKTNESNPIQVLYGESENSKLKFIKYMVDYFFDKQILEVRNNEKSTRKND
ncbi:MAG: hypothetical protein N4A62_17325 [Marinisporobacter sp.]|jgi:hypothetical protein|nr:hypothetical protein [Marinisporobacter sp.]